MDYLSWVLIILGVVFGLPLVAYVLSHLPLKQCLVWLMDTFQKRPSHTTVPKVLYGHRTKGSQSYFIASGTRPITFTTLPIPGEMRVDLRHVHNGVDESENTSSKDRSLNSLSSYIMSALAVWINCSNLLEIVAYFIDSFWALIQVILYIGLLMIEFLWGLTKLLSNLTMSSNEASPSESGDYDYDYDEQYEGSENPKAASLGLKGGFLGWFSPPTFSHIRKRTIENWISYICSLFNGSNVSYTHNSNRNNVSFIIPSYSMTNRDRIDAEYNRRLKLMAEALSTDRKLRGVAYAKARTLSRQSDYNHLESGTGVAQRSCERIHSVQPHPYLPETEQILSPRSREVLQIESISCQCRCGVENDALKTELKKENQSFQSLALSSEFGLLDEGMQSALYSLFKEDSFNNFSVKKPELIKDKGDSTRDWLARGASTLSLVSVVLPKTVASIEGESKMQIDCKTNAQNEHDKLYDSISSSVDKAKKKVRNIAEQLEKGNSKRDVLETFEQNESYNSPHTIGVEQSLFSAYFSAELHEISEDGSVTAQSQVNLSHHKSIEEVESEDDPRIIRISDESTLRRVANRLDCANLQTTLDTEQHNACPSSDMQSGFVGSYLKFFKGFWSNIGSAFLFPLNSTDHDVLDSEYNEW